MWTVSEDCVIGSLHGEGRVPSRWVKLGRGAVKVSRWLVKDLSRPSSHLSAAAAAAALPSRPPVLHAPRHATPAIRPGSAPLGCAEGSLPPFPSVAPSSSGSSAFHGSGRLDGLVSRDEAGEDRDRPTKRLEHCRGVRRPLGPPDADRSMIRLRVLCCPSPSVRAMLI